MISEMMKKVDDMQKNCDAWSELGGRAIVHKSIDLTIEEMAEIYKNTYKPNHTEKGFE